MKNDTGLFLLGAGIALGLVWLVSRKSSIELYGLTIAPDDYELGEDVDISVVATNTGNTAAKKKVSLMINGVKTQEVMVNLEPGSNTQITFSVIPITLDSYSIV